MSYVLVRVPLQSSVEDQQETHQDQEEPFKVISPLSAKRQVLCGIEFVGGGKSGGKGGNLLRIQEKKNTFQGSRELTCLIVPVLLNLPSHPPLCLFTGSTQGTSARFRKDHGRVRADNGTDPDTSTT